MSFTSPDRLIWLWVALPIIGLYILKTRLRRRQVATLLFWDQLFEEKRQRTLWQNLRHWLSLLLQLIIVTIVVLALVDPTFRFRSDDSQELVLIVDNSASMQALDPASGRSRLEEAIEQAAEFAAGLRQGDHAALMTAGSRVNVVVGLTDFAPAIEEGLETVEPTDGLTRIDGAIEAARRLASDAKKRRIIVFSDACLAEVPQPEKDSDVRWVQVGASVDNVAITQFQARRSTVDPIGYAVLIEVQNFGNAAAAGRLTLELGKTLVDVIPYTLEPDETWRTTIDGTSREGGILQASIDADDGLAADNTVRAIIPNRPIVPVRLVTATEDEAYYLRTVLESIPLLELADETNREASEPARPTITVFSGNIPSQLPNGPILIVAPQQNGPDIETNGQTAPAWIIGAVSESPLIARQHQESPLLTHVQLQNVLLDGGRHVQVNEGLGQPTTLLETADGAAVLVAVERLEGRILILAGDLDSSDLPLRIAFPVMMTNAVNWFLRRTNEINPALSTGEVASIPWDVADDDDNNEAMLIDAAGSRRRVTVDNHRASVGPVERVGVLGLLVPSTLPQPDTAGQTPLTPEELLQKTPESKGELVAINLCDAPESDLRLPEVQSRSEADLPPAGAPAWLFFVFGAIGLVLGEWALFNRRVIA